MVRTTHNIKILTQRALRRKSRERANKEEREQGQRQKNKNRTKTTLTSVTQIRGKTMTPKFGHKNTTIGDKYDKALTSAAIAVN